LDGIAVLSAEDMVGIEQFLLERFLPGADARRRCQQGDDGLNLPEEQKVPLATNSSKSLEILVDNP